MTGALPGSQSCLGLSFESQVTQSIDAHTPLMGPSQDSAWVFSGPFPANGSMREAGLALVQSHVPDNPQHVLAFIACREENTPGMSIRRSCMRQSEDEADHACSKLEDLESSDRPECYMAASAYPSAAVGRPQGCIYMLLFFMADGGCCTRSPLRGARPRGRGGGGGGCICTQAR